ncbi:sugar-binding domain-containing protein [Cellulomonas sp. PhB143]|uniref:sugar-binding domain-containing protein n=1 Tax=Cellulomonas sp. PhB143 TaxID=2485186 RepID=UPI001F18DB94|nr:sugar-binding domain-containing protein [Cellulomonas sp. PhB143]
MTAAPARATQNDGTYPRPQLVRPAWTDLCGAWDFAVDADDAGLAERWYEPGSAAFDRTITVPFPPEAQASGVGETGFLGVVWYRRTVAAGDVPALGCGNGTGTDTGASCTLLNFGAVDHSCDVWADGRLVGSHTGGQTPFTLDLTDAVRRADGGDLTLVVRAVDDPLDVAQPRGKQDWQVDPHAIWYDRTTGIWQPVWLETVPRCTSSASRGRRTWPPRPCASRSC